MADFSIRKGDRLPELQVTLTDSAGAAVNVTGLAIAFHLRAISRGQGAAAKVNSAATLVTPATGVVKYVWAAVDTDTTGLYHAEFEVTFADGRKQTFPNPDYITVEITDDLAP